jgi:hypothetical protein
MFDALTAPPRVVTPQEWESVLRQLQLTHNPAKSAHMLAKIGDGMVLARDRFGAALQGFIFPPIAIPTDTLPRPWSEYEGRCVYSVRKNIVIVTQAWLNALSELPIDCVVDITGRAGEVSFRGRLLDYCFFTGVEELDHACYRYEHGEHDSGATPSASLRECDATNIEWRALCRQLKISEELNFSEITRQTFRSRIAVATIVRKS